MRLTIEEYAHQRGVSATTIEWMCTPPSSRPLCETYVDDVPEVFTSWRRFAALWGCSENAVRYQLRRGLLVPAHNGGLGVHHADLAWGLRYYDVRIADVDQAVEATIRYQAIERELIMLGHLRPDGLIEAQLACVARSPEWWRRNLPKPSDSDLLRPPRRPARPARSLIYPAGCKTASPTRSPPCHRV